MNSNRIVGMALHKLPVFRLLAGSALQARDRPDSPQNLRVTIDNGEATVRWNPVEGATLYRLILRAKTGPDGSELRRQLWAPEPGKPSTSLIIPHDFLVPGVPVRLNLTAIERSAPRTSRPATLEFVPPASLARSPAPGSGKVAGGRQNIDALDGIPIGAIGRIFRENDVLSVYEIVSPTAGALALQVTPAEVDAAHTARLEVADVKTSADGRVEISVWPNMNILVSMGPNPEGKVLHTLLQGGLFGPVIRTYTTCDARPPGNEWYLLPRLA